MGRILKKINLHYEKCCCKKFFYKQKYQVVLYIDIISLDL